MDDISDLERRLTAALDRISTGIVPLQIPGPEPEPAPVDTGLPSAEQLLAELESEREVTAQLEERVRAIREKQHTRVAELEAEGERLAQALAASEAEVAQLRGVTEALRGNNDALRQANEAGVGDPELIDTAMRTELEALRAQHRSDRAEIEAILAELAPILEGDASNA
ncbi:hypothetical protein EKE94_02020 [Mesobaculum littorinae]|uniref:Uncharacterized protein n=1 Tax=Mesobaculum littorinae TaxID=2486419 RepID=A0A438ALD4_9RHOB|nr:hypothetical protein [Mesobaculum littorinae]RVV99482.1 hypothetical protein EKE94_02020 [Mesobaculum littorinae]